MPLLESELSQQVRDYLEHRGFRLVRNHRRLVPLPGGKYEQIGEPGMADWLALHYKPPAIIWIEMKRNANRTSRCICLTKKPRERCTACDQAAWHQAERARGGTVWIIDGLERLERYLIEGGYQERVQRQQEIKFSA